MGPEMEFGQLFHIIAFYRVLIWRPLWYLYIIPYFLCFIYLTIIHYLIDILIAYALAKHFEENKSHDVSGTIAADDLAPLFSVAPFTNMV